MHEMDDVHGEAAGDDRYDDAEEHPPVPLGETLDVSGEAVDPRDSCEPAPGFHVLLVLLPVLRVILVGHLLPDDDVLPLSHGLDVWLIG